MSEYRFTQVDVFGSGAFLGNPVAVVHGADDRTDDELQTFARWTNLSETTFLLSSTDDSDYRVRIFTPSGELPFAGHPTLGTCHAWLEAGGTPGTDGQVTQQCGIGQVTVRRGERLAFKAPPRTRTGPVDEPTLEIVARGLGIAQGDILDHQWVVNGPRWLAVRLINADAVRALRPDVSAFGDLDVGVVGMFGPGSPQAYEVRAFVPAPAPPEDPVTGSLNAGVAQWLRETGLVPANYTVRQGTALHRSGIVAIEDDGQDIWVGGATTTRVRGTVTF